MMYMLQMNIVSMTAIAVNANRSDFTLRRRLTSGLPTMSYKFQCSTCFNTSTIDIARPTPTKNQSFVDFQSTVRALVPSCDACGGLGVCPEIDIGTEKVWYETGLRENQVREDKRKAKLQAQKDLEKALEESEKSLKKEIEENERFERELEEAIKLSQKQPNHAGVVGQNRTAERDEFGRMSIKYFKEVAVEETKKRRERIEINKKRIERLRKQIKQGPKIPEYSGFTAQLMTSCNELKLNQQVNVTYKRPNWKEDQYETMKCKIIKVSGKTNNLCVVELDDDTGNQDYFHDSIFSKMKLKYKNGTLRPLRFCYC